MMSQITTSTHERKDRNMHSLHAYSNSSKMLETKGQERIGFKKKKGKSNLCDALHHPSSDLLSKFIDSDGTSKRSVWRSDNNILAPHVRFLRHRVEREPLCPPAMSIEEVIKCNEDAVQALRKSNFAKSKELIETALGAAENAVRWFQNSLSRFRAVKPVKKVPCDLIDAEQHRAQFEGWLLLYAVSLNNMGCQFRREGRMREALECLQSAQDAETHVCGRASCSTMMNFSTLLLCMDKIEEALPIAQECVMTAQDSDRTLFITALHNLAITLGRHKAAKQRSAALPTMLRAFREAQNYFGPNHDTTKLLKGLCDTSHAWVFSKLATKEAPRLPSVTHVKKSSALGEIDSRELTRRSPSRSGYDSFRDRVNDLAHFTSFKAGSVVKNKKSNTKRLPVQLTPLDANSVAKAQGQEPSSNHRHFLLQNRAREALSTFHFGTPLASSSHSDQLSGSNVEQAASDSSHQILTQIPDATIAMSSHSNAQDRTILSDSGSSIAAHSVLETADLNTHSEKSEGVERVKVVLTNQVEVTSAPEPVHASPSSSTQNGEALASYAASENIIVPNLSGSTKNTSESSCTERRQSPDKGPDKIAVNRASSLLHSSLSTKNETKVLKSTLTCCEKIPGYYISLSHSTQPKYLRFGAENLGCVSNSNDFQTSNRVASCDLGEDLTEAQANILSSNKEPLVNSEFLFRAKCEPSRQKHKSSSFDLKDLHTLHCSSNNKPAHAPHACGKEDKAHGNSTDTVDQYDNRINTSVKLKNNSLPYKEDKESKSALKIFSLRGNDTNNIVLQNIIEEELKEEELFRQKRAQDEIEAAKEAQRRAILNRIQERVQNRAAARIQEQWRRWWQGMGWSRRDARRALAEQKSRYLRQRKLLTTILGSEKEWMIRSSCCQHYSVIAAVAVKCGMKWLKKTSCVRYFARNALRHNGHRENNIFALITKIQSTWRGFRTRLHPPHNTKRNVIVSDMTQMEQRLRDQREYAAIVLQKFARSILAKKKYTEQYLARYNPPAHRIQLWFRKLMSSLRERGLDRLTIWTRKVAALRIQRSWRRYQLRLQYYMYRLRLQISALRDEENRVALDCIEEPITTSSAPAKSAFNSLPLKEGHSQCMDHEEQTDSFEQTKVSACADERDQKKFQLFPLHTKYELECLERAPKVTRILEKEYENFYLRLYLEPASLQVRQKWITAINGDTLAINQKRAVVEFLKQEQEKKAIEHYRRSHAAIRIQRSFRSWLRMYNDPHRYKEWLLQSRKIYQERERMRIRKQDDGMNAQERFFSPSSDVVHSA